MAIELHDVPVTGSEFNIYVDDFVEGNENFSALAYPDSVGVPTIGYGYALLIKVDGQWQIPSYLPADFKSVGIDITQYSGTLNKIASDLNIGNVAGADALTESLSTTVVGSGVPALELTSRDQAQTLFSYSQARQIKRVEIGSE